MQAVRWRHERVTKTDISFRLTHLPYNSFRKLQFLCWSCCDNSDFDISIELVDLQACMCLDASRIKTSFTKSDAEINKIKCVNLYIGMINTSYNCNSWNGQNMYHVEGKRGMILGSGGRARRKEATRNTLKFLSSWTIGRFSRRTQLHCVIKVDIIELRTNKEQVVCKPVNLETTM
jgi:hypothetical protein